MSPRPAHDLTRMPSKQSRDIAALHLLLADCYTAQVAFTSDAGVDVIPTAVAVLDDLLVWHGSTGSRWMQVVAGGIPVAVSVFQLDALVVARSSFENSFWFRSAVLRGTPRLLLDQDKVRGLDAITERILPGRADEVRGHLPRELAASMVLAIPIDDWTLKLSSDWPDDSDDDLATDVWAGILPVATTIGPPIAAPDLRPGIDMSDSCRRLSAAPQ